MSNEYKPTYVDNTDNSISIMESTDTISFCKTGTKINTLSAKNMVHKKTGEDLNLCAYDGSSFNPVIIINNNHSDCRIMTNLNVNGNININNNLIIPTHNNSNLLSNVQGSIYFNTTENMYEGYVGDNEGQGWQPLGGFSKTKNATIHKNLNVLGNINIIGNGIINTSLGIGTTSLNNGFTSSNVHTNSILDINGQTTIRGHILPSQNSQFDLGNAEYKIRHLFLSDNSLWIGDKHKIDVSDGTIKFRKRKTTTIPTSIDAIKGGDDDVAIQTWVKNEFEHGSLPAISAIKLEEWHAYAQSKQANIKIEDIFKSGIEGDWDENDTTMDKLVIKNNIDVSGNINLTNEGMIRTTGIGSFGSINCGVGTFTSLDANDGLIKTTGIGSFGSIHCGVGTFSSIDTGSGLIKTTGIGSFGSINCGVGTFTSLDANDGLIKTTGIGSFGSIHCGVGTFSSIDTGSGLIKTTGIGSFGLIHCGIGTFTSLDANDGLIKTTGIGSFGSINCGVGTFTTIDINDGTIDNVNIANSTWNGTALGSLATLNNIDNSNWSGTKLSEANGGSPWTTSSGSDIYRSSGNVGIGQSVADYKLDVVILRKLLQIFKDLVTVLYKFQVVIYPILRKLDIL